jgi:hypothetical protein
MRKKKRRRRRRLVWLVGPFLVDSSL